MKRCGSSWIRTVSPTSVTDAAAVMRAAIGNGLPFGLYHCVNSGRCTWWEFAEEAARLMGRKRGSSRLRSPTFQCGRRGRDTPHSRTRSWRTLAWRFPNGATRCGVWWHPPSDDATTPVIVDAR